MLCCAATYCVPLLATQSHALSSSPPLRIKGKALVSAGSFSYLIDKNQYQNKNKNQYQPQDGSKRRKPEPEFSAGLGGDRAMEGEVAGVEGGEGRKSREGSSEAGEKRTVLGTRTQYRAVQLRGDGKESEGEGEVANEVEREHHQWAASQAVEVSTSTDTLIAQR
jgi:hypothetical protein